MQAEEVILQIRSRLRDTDYTALMFSDNEILDTLNQIQMRLVYNFDANIQTHHANITPKNPQLYSAQAILKIIAATLENKPLTLATYAQTLRHPPKVPTLIQINPNCYEVIPAQVGELVIYANTAPKNIDSPSDELTLSEIYIKALVLGALANLAEIETSAQNLERMRIYKALYKEECDFLRALVNDGREKRAFTTPYIRA